jgi:hypothetical protein
MKSVELPDRLRAGERYGPVLACQIGTLFDLATDPNFHFSCTVTQQGGMTARQNAMQYFPPNGGLPWPCLSALLTLGGVIEPAATVVGYIEVFRDGPIWMGWANNMQISVEPEDQFCMGNTIWATASDGNIYAVTMAAHWSPQFPQLKFRDSIQQR